MTTPNPTPEVSSLDNWTEIEKVLQFVSESPGNAAILDQHTAASILAKVAAMDLQITSLKAKGLLAEWAGG